MAQAEERKASWKKRDDNTLIGTRIPRLDGQEKATGQAKYASDINTAETLFAKCLTCNHAHAKVKSLDIQQAKTLKGVHAVHVFNDVDAEIQWDGTLIAAVAAETLDIATTAIRLIKVEYEVLEHWVDEADLKGAEAAERTRILGDDQQGDVTAACENAEVVHKGTYGITTISHMCLEPHGSHCEWNGEELVAHLSTQNVSGTAGQFAGPLAVDAARVNVICNNIGGGFGSKFAVDEWGVACAKLAKEAGRPVRLMLDRATELKIAGTRPSAFADVTIASLADGTITAWDSHHWGTSGIAGATVSLTQFPYVFDFPNRNRTATGISTHTGPNRPWRAPAHPQACAVTATAMDDLAAKLKMDSFDVFLKNLDKTPRPEVYKSQMEIAAKLIGWKEKWHPRGQAVGRVGGPDGAVKQGLGMALHQWAGRAHAASCTIRIHPDGTVESLGGTQDIGTGTRTAIAMVIAETFGLSHTDVVVKIGDNKYPRSGPSGGSTTIGGVTGPNRRGALEALWKIFDLVAEKYEVDANTLTAASGNIFQGDQKVCTWKQAASLVGPMALEVQGKGPAKDGLTDQGVGGVQMADVSVDTETGVVRINKLVAVQDCGMIVDLMTAESQVYGGLVMGIAYSLTEERIMDNQTGRFINADMINYKLPRIGDIGELVVEMYQPDDEYQRGVIGLGEPPVISTGAAISNAVANAIGVRVPVLPITPKRVLEALQGVQA